MKLYRKVACFNHTSLSMNIPSDVVVSMDLKKGDYVCIDYKEGVMTVEKAPNKIREIAEGNTK